MPFKIPENAPKCHRLYQIEKMSKPFSDIRVYDFISPETCQQLIDTVTDMNKWSTGRHDHYPTTDVPMLNLSTNEEKLVEPIYEQLITSLQSIVWYDYGLKVRGIYDMFLVKYDEDQQGLGIHQDQSLLSFVITLNNDFEGGGTIIQELDTSLVHDIGTITVHYGKLQHGAKPVKKGSRYVIIGFCDITDGPLYNIDEITGMVYPKN